jgi:dTDP-4-dehydrorhamnose 3,5-epimerase-like enzyme
MVDPLPQPIPGGCRLVSLPQIPEPRGNLTALGELAELPFRIGAVRWFYDMPAGGSWTAGEADLGEAMIVALSGSFDAVIGLRGQARVRLSRATTGLLVPAGARWMVDDLSTNSVGLVISSRPNRAYPLGLDQVDEAVPVLNRNSTIDDCHTITLPRQRRSHGCTARALPRMDVPFDVTRVYYVYDIPGGATRGGHAHRQVDEVLLAVAGSFDVVLNDGLRMRSSRLDRAHAGIFIPTGIWRELENFSSGAVCLVLASAPYDEADYIRDYDEFRREKHGPLRDPDSSSGVGRLRVGGASSRSRR